MHLQNTLQLTIRSKLETKTKPHLNSSLTRLCSESDFIYRNTLQVQMNSKGEWHQPAVPRVVVTMELEEIGRQRQAAGEREENMRRSLVGHSQTNPDPS